MTTTKTEKAVTFIDLEPEICALANLASLYCTAINQLFTTPPSDGTFLALGEADGNAVIYGAHEIDSKMADLRARYYAAYPNGRGQDT